MRHIQVGCILLSTALSGQAATLGRHSGAAVIGRPLDVRIQALLAPGEDLASQCARAEVFYGDNQVAGSAVRVQSQSAAPDASVSLRVQSTLPVNEPIVTVYARIGCTAPFSRRYVLLADPVTEPVASVSVATAVPDLSPADKRQLPTVPSSVPAPAPIGSGDGARASSTAPTAAAATESPTRAKRPAKATAPAAEAPAPRKPQTPAVVRRPVAPAAPRLELEPVDLSLMIDRDPVLRLSMNMLSEPATTDEARNAAARLWKAVNASPEDILRDNQKLQVLEAEAKGLREQEERSRTTIASMQSQLDDARYLSWLVYGLGAALVAALGGAYLLWRRGGMGKGKGDVAARAWWAAASAEKEMGGHPVIPEGKIGAKVVDLDLDLDLDLGADSRRAAADSMRSLGDSEYDLDSTPAALAPRDKREFAPSQMGVSRSVATEELFDVQQQADFFVSLGEIEQAIEVLRNHLTESPEPSPLAYLDLISLYHRHGRRDEYRHLRDEFNRTFNAGVPPFDQYTDSSRGLLDYENALRRIQSLWPDPKVLDVIEKSIFREADDSEGEVFDLEAYRELLLLHAIAKEVIQREVADSHPSGDFAHTAIKPLKAAGSDALAAAAVASAAAANTQPMEDMPRGSPRLGLDVDLDELSEISAFEASLPEVSAPLQPTAKPSSAPGGSSDDGLGNLIDFEMLDFMPPDEDEKKGG